jgi:hypothetical protein
VDSAQFWWNLNGNTSGESGFRSVAYIVGDSYERKLINVFCIMSKVTEMMYIFLHCT